jgi:cell division protein FtsB
MNSKATFAMVIVLIIAGFAYAATPQKSDDAEVTELKQTVTALKERVAKLEARVNDMATAKPRPINENIHPLNQH